MKQLDSVLDVETVSMEPVRLVRFVWQNSIHPLRHPIQVAVERAGDVWVYNCALVNLWGVGERREEALADLNENFDFLWQEYWPFAGFYLGHQDASDHFWAVLLPGAARVELQREPMSRGLNG